MRQYVGEEHPNGDPNEDTAKNAEEPNNAALFLQPRPQPAAGHKPARKDQTDKTEYEKEDHGLRVLGAVVLVIGS